MKGQKAKLIKKLALNLWEKKSAEDRQKWGLPAEKDFWGIIRIGTGTAFNRFYRHLKKSYEQGSFKIS